jgi:hypothetical protein
MRAGEGQALVSDDTHLGLMGWPWGSAADRLVHAQF